MNHHRPIQSGISRVHTETASDTFLSENERRILDLIRRSAASTRAELTRATGLTAQSISRLVDALITRGLLRFGDKVISGRGQPSTKVSLVPSAQYTVGFSIMTDAVSAALMDLSGQVIASRHRALRSMKRGPVLTEMSRALNALCDKETVDPNRVAGVGVGITGYFVGRGRQVNPPGELDDWSLVDVDKIMADHFERPVWVDNDGNMAATGEALAGIGRDYSTFAYLYFAYGIGGSVVINGSVFRGAFGNAGEFAGILPPEVHDERPSLEFLRQTLESSGKSLPDLNALVNGFRMDWPGVDVWIARSLPHLQAMVSAIAAVVDPEAIVFGGRLPPPLSEHLIQKLKFYSVPRRNVPRPFPKLLTSRVQGDATAIGASASPLKEIFFI